MNIIFPYNWIKQYIPDLKVSAKEIAKKLSLHSHSVEKIEKIGGEEVFEIEMTSNRPDCFGIIGMAREIAVLFGKKLKVDQIDLPKTETNKQLFLQIENKAPELCRRIYGVILDNVKVLDSSKLIQKRLKQIGLRPVNNIVDLTNYVMRETGQPLHAFDYDEINGKKMTICLSKKEGKLELLDGQVCQFKNSALIIQDQERIVDLLGIMGGKNSGVTEKTKRIFLQAPNIDGMQIRKTWREFDLHTDAAILFEKGLDPRACEPAVLRAAQMIQQIAQGKIASQVIDFYPQKIKAKIIQFDLEKVEKILGLKIAKQKILQILQDLGFKAAVGSSQDCYKITAPYWRHNDINIAEDLIEEIGRIYGYYKLPSYALTGALPKVDQDLNLQLKTEERSRDLLKDLGFIEILTYSLTSEKNVSPEHAVKTSNPLSNEFEYMRTALLPGLLETAQKNQKTIEKIQIFELSKVYAFNNQQAPQEKIHLGFLVSGKEKFYFLKGVLENFLQELGIKKVKYNCSSASSFFDLDESAEIKINETKIGQMGLISKETLKKYNLKNLYYGLEIDFNELMEHYNSSKKFKKIPKYPAAYLDLSILVKKNILWYDLEQRIFKAGKPLLRTVDVFDVYKGKDMPQNCRSIAFHLEFRSKKHNLKDEEVKIAQDKIIKSLKEFGVKIREK